jgi:hypothetical protein
VNRVKKILREVCIIAMMSVVGYAAIVGVLAYKDWRGCICSVLTSTEQTLPIDEKLYRVYEQDALRSGTFTIVRTKCDHNVEMLLRISPDECQFTGKLI